jgi:ABC-type transport system involved in cytochrome bd biosynthesis fused ATPase/permease subunit
MSTFPPGGGGLPPPVIPMDCDSPACTNAKAELDAARVAFNRVCSTLRTVTSILRVLRPIISAPLWIIIVIVIIAILAWLFGLGPIAILLWTLIFLYLIAWFLVIVFTRVAASLTQDLANQGKAIADAIAKVVASCPENCRGDLSIPVCDVGGP